MKTPVLPVALALAAALAAGPAAAQQPQRELRLHVSPYAGVFIPTGGQRDVLDDAVLTGAVVSYDLAPWLGLVGGFAWVPTEVKGLSRGGLDLFQYDLGVQGQYALALGRGVELQPFAGVGMGLRSYRFRELGLGSETDVAWYSALGTEIRYRSAVFGLTGRHYLSTSDGLGLTHRTSTRSEVGVFASAGFRL